MFDSDTETSIEDNAGRFPVQMLLIRDVFSFSFAQATETGQFFSGAVDFCNIFEKIIAFLQSSSLPPEDIETLVTLMQEEAEVISFSLRSRSGVIAL